MARKNKPETSKTETAPPKPLTAEESAKERQANADFHHEHSKKIAGRGKHQKDDGDE